jgi:hypothetical protein
LCSPKSKVNTDLKDAESSTVAGHLTRREE